jgi:hypothetical protein
MLTIHRCTRTLPALLLGLCALAGCESDGHFTCLGYTTQPTYDMSIRTVYVPIAENWSYERELEFWLTKSVVRELGANSPYRVISDRSKADTELCMKIIARPKNVILVNQLGEVRDSELRLVIQVVWKDLRAGHVGDILSNPRRFDPTLKPLPGEPAAKAPKEVPIQITPVTTYVPELGGSTRMAEQDACDKAARSIVQMMEIWR